MKGRTFSRIAYAAYPAAMSLDYFWRYEKTQSQTRKPSLIRSVMSLYEFIKYPVLHIFGDTYTEILYLYSDLSFFPFDSHKYFVFIGRIFDSIIYKIWNHLAYPEPVSVYDKFTSPPEIYFLTSAFGTPIKNVSLEV